MERLGTVGSRIEWLANQIGSQTELARLSGVQRRAIVRYIAGENQPREESLAAMAAVGSIPASWLRDGGPVPEVVLPRGSRHRVKRIITPDEAEDSFRPVWLGGRTGGAAIYTLSKTWSKQTLGVRPPDLGCAIVHGDVVLVDLSLDPLPGEGWLIKIEDPETPPVLAVGTIVRESPRKLCWVDPSFPKVRLPIQAVLGRVVARLSRA